MKNKLICGWGINDVCYITNIKYYENGKQTYISTCPYYEDWKEMIRRCFSSKFKEKQPAYKDCTIHEDWKCLSNFIKWVDSQPNKDWKNCSLDKDILVEGNKHYSPETCVYIGRKLNSFVTDSRKNRGKLMIGVFSCMSNKNPYRSECCNPLTRKREYLGVFSTELEAHLAWKAKKHEHAMRLADMQSDERVAKRLREMYTPTSEWTNK